MIKELVFTDDGEIYEKVPDTEMMPYLGRIDFLSHSLVMESGLRHLSRRIPESINTRAACEAWVRAIVRHPHTAERV